MRYAIKFNIDGEIVWFQALMPVDENKFDVAWTRPEDACSFGRFEAARDTALVLGGEPVEVS